MGQAATIDVASPRDDTELEAYAHLATHAFSGNPPAAPEMEWINKLGRENFLLARIDGQVAGGLGLIRMGQWFGGRSVPTVGLGAVVVAPEYRSRGVASQLLQTMLRQVAAEGIPLSCLYPSTQGVYRKAGYEQGGLAIRYRLPLAVIPALRAPLTMRRMSNDETDLLEQLYREQARRTAGNLDRSPYRWYEELSGKEVLNRYAIERDSLTEGYVIYHQQRRPSVPREIVVRDVVALTDDARQTVLSFLAGHRAIAKDAIIDGGPAEPLLVQLPQLGFSVVDYEQWLTRLIDVPAALRARGYAKAISAEVHLDVRDDVLTENNRLLVLTVERGEMTVHEGGNGAVKVDIRGLASIYTGYRSPLELLSSGYIEGEQDDLEQLGAIFAGPTPWMPDHF